MSDLTNDWLALRFRDLDGYGHVYHGEFLTLLDEARTRWFASIGLEGVDDYVLARMEIDWVSPLGPDDAAVRVDIEVAAIGTKSLTLLETMRATDDRVVSRSRSVTVPWNRRSGTSYALSESDLVILQQLVARVGPS